MTDLLAAGGRRPARSGRRLGTADLAFAAAAGVYLLLCVAAYWGVRPATQFYFTDYWEHRAAVAEVVRHGLHLTDFVYGEAAPSRQFTPWTFALGYLARWTGMGIDDAMAVGALAVSALFVVGTYVLARAYFARPWAPAVLLVALTCAWGVPAIIWTGFHPLRSQLHGNYYPAEVTFALLLLGWGWTVWLIRAERWTGRQGVIAAVLALNVAIAVVTHPLNALFLLVGAGAFVVLEPCVRLRRRAAVLLVLLAGVAASAAWPYFNPLSLAGPGVARGQATFNDFAFFYQPSFVLLTILPAWFAVIAAPAQWRNPRTRMPVMFGLAVFVAYVAGGIANVSVSHRLLAFIALPLQMMLAWIVLDRIDGHPPRPFDELSRRGWRCAAALAVVVVAMQVATAVQQLLRPYAWADVTEPVAPVDREMRVVAAALPPGATVLGWNSAALMLPAYGVRVVAFPRPMPLSPTDPARQSDYDRFFRPGTNACTRREIAARWHASHIAWLGLEVTPRMERTLSRLGSVANPVASWRIVRTPPPCR